MKVWAMLGGGRLGKKSGVLPQLEMGSIKSGGAAATRNGQEKKRGRCRNENRGSIKSGTLPLLEMGIIRSGGAAAARIGKYKKHGRCRNEKWAVYKAGRCCNEKWAL